MLVPKRKAHESVVMADEITQGVGEIRFDGEGRLLFGATMQQGFQTPRWRTEKLVGIPDVQTRLQIQLPRTIPV